MSETYIRAFSNVVTDASSHFILGEGNANADAKATLRPGFFSLTPLRVEDGKCFDGKTFILGLCFKLRKIPHRNVSLSSR